MTRTLIVTRADGSPAYASAKPRLRQSHASTLAKYCDRYAELREEDRLLSIANGERPEPGAFTGTAILAAVILMGVAWAVACFVEAA